MGKYFFVKYLYNIYIWVNYVYIRGCKMDVLKKINHMRLERNGSVYRLSVESNIPQSTLTNMFNRETLPSITSLECICNAFGISMSEFFKEPHEKEADEELISIIRSLSAEEKNVVRGLLELISRNSKEK